MENYVSCEVSKLTMFGMIFSFFMTQRICFQSAAFSMSSKQTDSRASLTTGGFVIDLTSANCCFLIELLSAIDCFHHQLNYNLF